MAHINKQLAELKHQIERSHLLELERHSLEGRLEDTMQEVNELKSKVNATDESRRNYRLSLANLFAKGKRKTNQEVQNVRPIVELKQKERDLALLQSEYDRIIDELNHQPDFDHEYEVLMKQKRMQANLHESEVLEQLESVIEKCRLENKRMLDAQRLGERSLALIQEVFGGFSMEDRRLFESPIARGGKQFEKLNEVQDVIAQIKRLLEQFEKAYERCPKLGDTTLDLEFVSIADQIIDNFLMDYFFEDEVYDLKKKIMQIKKQIVAVLHDLDIQLRMNQNKILDMLDCINAVGDVHE